MRAAQEVIDGELDDEFPLVVFQTGSGTQIEHERQRGDRQPRDPARRRRGRLARSRSTRTTTSTAASRRTTPFPTVMHIATVEEIDDALMPGGRAAARHARRPRRAAFADVVMVGRTHLQDATPVTLGQVIGGWVAQLDERARRHRAGAAERCIALALGGTAVGTGLNAHPRFGEVAARQIARGDGQAVRVGAEQVRGAVGARRDGQRQRRAADAGRRADEDRQRRALVRLRAARGLRRAARSPRTSRARRSCRARSTRRSARR